MLDLDNGTLGLAEPSERVDVPHSALLFLAWLVEKGPLTASVLYGLACRHPRESKRSRSAIELADGYSRYQLSLLRKAFGTLRMPCPVHKKGRGPAAPYYLAEDEAPIRVCSSVLPFEDRLLNQAIREYDRKAHRGCLETLCENDALETGSYCYRSRGALYAMRATLAMRDMSAAFGYERDVMPSLLLEEERRLHREAVALLSERRSA
ncbi:MAG TPA: hypothetical protein PKI11_05265 [Candidatus Hydrogenedentes bacterium]|nr:hypothetical protein [Candidatus Hydrogenedentota bacterium]